MYEQFKGQVRKAKEFFYQFDKAKPVRVISHLDADGIAAASILIRLLNLDNRNYAISIVQSLTKKVINELHNENYEQYVFTDLGSGQLDFIKEVFKQKKVLILDHHGIRKDNCADHGADADNPDALHNIFHLNPHLFGINGTDEISGAGVVFLFAKECDDKIKSLANIAIVGAIGDLQECKGFKKLNKEILELAIESNLITVKRGLKFFGAYTKPLYKVLYYSTDPFIPGVSGSESGAIQFLQALGISPKQGSEWRNLGDLSDDEISRLVSGIVMRRVSETNPEDIIDNLYINTGYSLDSPARDCREFSTLLNACGRMGKASLGIGVCLGDDNITKKAIMSQQDYRVELMQAINWYNANKSNALFVIRGEGYLIINAGEHIRPAIIGTLASIISKSNDVIDNVFIMSLARNDDGTTKVSLRVSGSRRDPNLNLKKLMTDMVERIGGETGGHQFAAGATIATENEARLVTAAKDLLKQSSLLESVV